MRFNQSLLFLDLFDVDLTSNSIPIFVEALEKIDTLFSLRLANTHVNINYVQILWDFIKSHISIKVFRWYNIDQTYQQPNVAYEPFFI